MSTTMYAKWIITVIPPKLDMSTLNRESWEFGEITQPCMMCGVHSLWNTCGFTEVWKYSIWCDLLVVTINTPQKLRPTTAASNSQLYVHKPLSVSTAFSIYTWILAIIGDIHASTSLCFIRLSVPWFWVTETSKNLPFLRCFSLTCWESFFPCVCWNLTAQSTGFVFYPISWEPRPHEKRTRAWAKNLLAA